MVPRRRALGALFVTSSLLPLAAQSPTPVPAPAPAPAPAAAPAPADDVRVRCVPAFPAQDPFDKPLAVDFTDTDPDHAYVVSQSGKVWVVPRDGSRKDRREFLDLSKQVFMENWEEGLLGFQFDPGYAQDGFVYVYWTEKTPEREGDMGGVKSKSYRQSVVSRFGTRPATAGGREVDPATELRVLVVYQPFGNHNGGTLRFGPDGMLYIALGDGGLGGDPFDNGQNRRSLLGKVLRIDVRGATAAKPYAIPADNPFVGDAEARGEIWCWGLRNPWRIAFDRATGELWCGDVGQDRIEEIDRLVKGGNYGWNHMEGKQRFRERKQKGAMPKDLIAPVHTYDRTFGSSVTGGHVYRGKLLPGLQGWYVFGDFTTMRMGAVLAGADGAKTRFQEIGKAPAALSSFAEQPDGELLVTCFDGRVYRLEAEPADGGK